MTNAEAYIATFRGEAPETIREAIAAVDSVVPDSQEHAAKLRAIADGLRALLPPEPQGSLF